MNMQAAFVFSFVSHLPTADREESLFLCLRSSAKDCSISDLIWPLVSCLHSGIRIGLLGDTEKYKHTNTHIGKWLRRWSLFGFMESVGNKRVVSSEVLSGDVSDTPADDYYFTFQHPSLFSRFNLFPFCLLPWWYCMYLHLCPRINLTWGVLLAKTVQVNFCEPFWSKGWRVYAQSPRY